MGAVKIPNALAQSRASVQLAITTPRCIEVQRAAESGHATSVLVDGLRFRIKKHDNEVSLCRIILN